MAAENCPDCDGSGEAEPCFNEAAANGRGKRRRPRGLGSRPPSFNEAAANGRGKRRVYMICANAWPCFNEAAANGRGKRTCARRARVVRTRASMRPRRMAAEN